MGVLLHTSLLFVCCGQQGGHVAKALVVAIGDGAGGMEAIEDEEVEGAMLGCIGVGAVALQGSEHLLGHNGGGSLGDEPSPTLAG